MFSVRKGSHSQEGRMSEDSGINKREILRHITETTPPVPQKAVPPPLHLQSIPLWPQRREPIATFVLAIVGIVWVVFGIEVEWGWGIVVGVGFLTVGALSLLPQGSFH